MATINGTTASETLEGGAAVDQLNAGEGNDLLLGYAGIDSLIGGGGNDTLDGGTGGDWMAGGAGADTYIVDDVTDQITESGVAPGDLILSSVSYTMALYVEDMTLTGAAHIRGIGNTLNNRLQGNSGNNLLDGGTGNDTVLGGLGNDTVKGGMGVDLLAGGEGADMFRFRSVTESGPAANMADVISDFNAAEGDSIDLSQIDANTRLAGHQSFVFIGAGPFTAAGQVRFDRATGMLYASNDGDTTAEFAVRLAGVSSLTEAQLVLVDRSAPVFVSGTDASINERAGTGRLVYTAAIDDGPVTYSLQRTGDYALFKVNAATGAITLTPNPDFELRSSYTFTVVATDQSGNATQQTVTLSVRNIDEVRPVITSPAQPPAVDENSASLYTATATDLGDISAGVRWSLTGTDAALLDIDANGVVTRKSGAIDFESKASYAFTIVASDGVTQSVSRAVTVGVNNVNEAATDITVSANWIAENTATGGGVRVAVLGIADPDAAGNANVLSVGGADANLFAIRNGNELFYTGASPDFETTQRVFNLTLSSTDGTLVYAEALTVSVADVQEAPVVANPLADQQVVEGDLFIYAVDADAFTDPDAGSQLTFSATLANGSALPEWLSFDAAARTFSGVPAGADVGSITVRVSANDTGFTTTDDFVLVVAQRDTEATGSYEIFGAVEEGGQVSIGGWASDPEVVVSATYGWETSRDGAAWTPLPGPSSALLQIPADESYVGLYLRGTVQTTDANGGTTDFVTPALQVAGVNDAPAITSAAQAGAVAEDGLLTVGGDVLASDPDGATLSFAGDAAGSYGSLAVDEGTGAWSYTLDNDAHQDLAGGATHTDTFSVTVSDGAGGSASQAVTITVTGQNDAATIGGNRLRIVSEANAAASTSGTLTIIDIDSSATFTPQAGTLGNYGTFALGSSGAWTYVMDGAHDEFRVGTSYVDTFSVAAADGTTTSVTVQISGKNDAAVLGSASVGVTEGDRASDISTGGTLSISDVDSAQTFAVQADTAGTYGKFSIGSGGAWTYAATSAHNQFVDGVTYVDTFSVASADGTTTSVTVTITGTNDAAVIAGGTTLSFSETDAAQTVNGLLSVSDADGEAAFQDQAGTAGNYGTFTLTSDGGWTYEMREAHDAFAPGLTYNESFTVAAMDGTTGSVTIHIAGSNDAAVMTAPVAVVSEGDQAVALNASGTLAVSDVDGAAKVRAQSDTAGRYGGFSIDGAGNWQFTGNGAHDEFIGGKTYTDTFVVLSADGTSSSVTVHITGTNDAADVGSAVVEVTEGNAAADIAASGNLTIRDVDSSETFVPQTDTLGAYGSFSIDAAGAWTFTAAGAHDEFVGGRTYVDTFAVESADGTSTTVKIIITGTDDAAVVEAATVELVEASTAAAISTSGLLVNGDADGPAGFNAQAGVAGSHGTFAIGTSGAWTYTASSAHDEFEEGVTYVDAFNVTAADGTSTSVTIRITGADEPANTAPTITEPVAGATGLTFTATDDSEEAMTYAFPFEAFGAITSGEVTTFTAVQGASVLAGDLMIVDGAGASTAVGIYVALGSANYDNISTTGGAAALYGFDGNDTLQGGSGDDVLVGGAGNDLMTGGAGNDLYIIGSGTPGEMNTVQWWGDGDDTISGSISAGATLQVHLAPGVLALDVATLGVANAGLLRITGNASDNTLTGAAGFDLILGGDGNDRLLAGGSSDALSGEDGDDTLIGGTGFDTLTGGAGNDSVQAGPGGASLGGEDGDDTLVGGAGNDAYFGGAGADRIVIGTMGAGELDVINGWQQGTDELVGTLSAGARLSVVLGNTAGHFDGTSTGNFINAGGRLDLTGALGHDSLRGGSGNDSINGGGFGNDTLDGAAGNDTLVGGIGNDHYTGGAGNDLFNLGFLEETATITDWGNGSDTLSGTISSGSRLHVTLHSGGVALLLGSAAGVLVVTGGSGDDTITAGSGSDTLAGNAGNDTMTGGAGADRFDIGTPASGETDTITDWGNGADSLGGVLNTGARLVVSTANSGVLFRGDLTATFSNNGGEVVVTGGTGNDTLVGGGANDTLNGGDGNDTLTGNAGNDSLAGGAGADVLFGGDGDDTLAGGAGNDSFVGGAGADTFSIGATVSGELDIVTDFGDGADTLTGTLSSGAVLSITSVALGVTFNGGTGAGFTNNGGAITFSAAGGDDNLLGGSGNDGLYGNGGNDTLIGGLGNDYLLGGAGNDTMTGGAGNDRFDVGTTAVGDVDTITDWGNGPDAGGVGTIVAGSRVNVTLADGGVNFNGNTGWTANGMLDVTGGTGNDVITGGNGGDSLAGGAGADAFYGEGGADTIAGGAGSDTMTGGADDDLFAVGTVAAGETDWIMDWGNGNDSGSGTVAAGASLLVFLHSGNVTFAGATAGYTNNGTIRVTGWLGNDHITAGAIGSYQLLGGEGSDTLVGGLGNDSYTGGAGNDVVRVGFMGSGEMDSVLSDWGNGLDVLEGVLNANSRLNITLHSTGVTFNGAGGGGFINNGGALAVTGGVGHDSITGGSGLDTLIGGAANDTLAGLGGNDSLQGGTGNDSMTGGTGADTFSVGTMQSGEIDTITDWGDGADVGTGTVSTGARVNVALVAAGVTFNAGAGFSASSGTFAVTGNLGDDTITGGSGADILAGAGGNDSLTGGNGVDTFTVASGTDTITDYLGGETLAVSSGAVANLTVTALTASATLSNSGTVNITASSTVSLANATGPNGYNVTTTNTTKVTMTGSRYNDSLTGNIGADQFIGGEGADTQVGGGGNDIFTVAPGSTVLTIGQSGVSPDTGTISGYDVVMDFSRGANDSIDVSTSPGPTVSSGTTDNQDSTLTIAGQTLKTHFVSPSGRILFDDAALFETPVDITSMSGVAAAVQYLQRHDWGNAGASLYFTALIDSTSHTFVFVQGANGLLDGISMLVDLVGVGGSSALTTATPTLTNHIGIF